MSPLTNPADWRLECLICGYDNTAGNVARMLQHARRKHDLDDVALAGAITSAPFGLHAVRHIWLLASGRPWMQAIPKGE